MITKFEVQNDLSMSNTTLDGPWTNQLNYDFVASYTINSLT